MALTDAGLAPEASGTLQVRQPGPGDFVRLKLRIMRNGMRGKGWRIALFVLGIIGGLWVAALGFLAFAASSFASAELRPVFAALAGTALVLAWVLVPLLFFGVDETLDPARFALLPVRRRTLAVGMLAAAAVGVPPIVTLIASLGSTVGAAVKGGPAAAIVAVLGALVGLALCVVASRAVTSAFAAMLRSRRVRDLAALIIALLGVSCGPLQQVVLLLVQRGESRQAGVIAEVLSWTPLAAPFVAYVDAIEGDWLLVPVRLAIGVAGVALLLWWWSTTIESAMVGTVSGAASRTHGAVAGQPVTGLFPRALRALPAGRFGALVAREVRYWGRDPRRRAGLISLLAASIVIPFAFGITSRSGGGIPLPIGLAFGGVFIALALANQFGNDGTAYALHMLIGVPGRLELTARALGLGVLTIPVLIVGAVIASVFTDNLDRLPAALGLGLAGFGVSVGIAGFISVLAAYPMPDSTNPFAVNSGAGSAKGLMSFVGLIGSTVLITPLVVAYFLLPDGLTWLLLPAGVLWGLGGGWLGTTAAGATLDRRMPELLIAVTPRRS